MKDLRVYSPFFGTLYDESQPVGRIGRGIHYSVLQCAEWFDVTRQPLKQAQLHEFVIIWDEDHDTRIIEAIERLYFAGLLSPVKFIGESKGVLTLLLAAKFYFCPLTDLAAYINAVRDIAENISTDCWGVEFGTFEHIEEGLHQCNIKDIIADSDYRSLLYLRHIDSLWRLGSKDFEPASYYPKEFS